MGIVAVSLAIVGPWLRQFDAILIVWLVVASLLGVVMWLLLLRLWGGRFEKGRVACGRPLLVIPRLAHRQFAFLHRLFGLIVTLSGIYFVYLFFQDNGDDLASIVGRAWALIFVTLGVCNVLTYFTVHARPLVVFCENGFFNGMSYAPWEKIDCDSWHSSYFGQWLELRSSGMPYLRLQFRVEDRAAIEAVLGPARDKYQLSTGPVSVPRSASQPRKIS